MFFHPGAISYNSAYYGQGSGSILMDNVRCEGTEWRLFDCSHTSPLYCGHYADASVLCSR